MTQGFWEHHKEHVENALNAKREKAQNSLVATQKGIKRTGFKTELELRNYVFKHAGVKNTKELYKKGEIYIPNKCPICGFWHNRDRQICVPCEFEKMK
jgi:hypothetical protein